MIRKAVALHGLSLYGLSMMLGSAAVRAAEPYLTWEEKQKGALEAGKLADLIVLDSDPLTIPPEKLLTMNVDITVVVGRIVYRRQPR